MAEPRQYVQNSGLTSLAAATTKVCVELATGATVTAAIYAWDISFDGLITGSGSSAIPVRVALVRTTAASSGGAAGTSVKIDQDKLAANVTTRVNDTTDGTSPTVIAEWLIPPTTAFSYQFPQGREVDMKISDFVELRVVSQTGMTTCNYQANLWWQE